MKIETVSVEPKQALAIRAECSFKELPSVIDGAFKEMSDFIKKNSLEVTGPAFDITYAFSKDKIDISPGIPIAGNPAPEGRMKLITTYGGKAIKAEYLGPYDGLGDAWQDFMKWVKDNNYKTTGYPFEVYTIGMDKESDPAKLQTDLYFPI